MIAPSVCRHTLVYVIRQRQRVSAGKRDGKRAAAGDGSRTHAEASRHGHADTRHTCRWEIGINPLVLAVVIHQHLTIVGLRHRVWDIHIQQPSQCRRTAAATTA